MSNHAFPSGRTPLSVPSKETLSVAETARLLGFEQTTVYRLIWREELRVCAGSARYRVPRAEIERFLARTQTHGERVRSRPKAARREPGAKRPARNPLARPPLNPARFFVPLASFGDRPIGGRLMKTIVPDDEALPPQSFVQVAEAGWTGDAGTQEE